MNDEERVENRKLTLSPIYDIDEEDFEKFKEIVKQCNGKWNTAFKQLLYRWDVSELYVKQGKRLDFLEGEIESLKQLLLEKSGIEDEIRDKLPKTFRGGVG